MYCTVTNTKQHTNNNKQHQQTNMYNTVTVPVYMESQQPTNPQTTTNSANTPNNNPQ